MTTFTGVQLEFDDFAGVQLGFDDFAGVQLGFDDFAGVQLGLPNDEYVAPAVAGILNMLRSEGKLFEGLKVVETPANMNKHSLAFCYMFKHKSECVGDD